MLADENWEHELASNSHLARDVSRKQAARRSSRVLGLVQPEDVEERVAAGRPGQSEDRRARLDESYDCQTSDGATVFGLEGQVQKGPALVESHRAPVQGRNPAKKFYFGPRTRPRPQNFFILGPALARARKKMLRVFQHW